ncbi:RNA polymerase II subunit A C-terminal domain phosphatase [Coemansia sp. RSA 2607]|nr:RNA polymerase II subunit A C-terminal domain phosphatase [Coemansia sp. RSA 2607]
MVRFAIICASNMNRSMEGHYQLQKHGYNIRSFGTGSAVRLPGRSADKPNVYKFGTPYKRILDDLLSQNFPQYTKIGLIDMLRRNKTVKEAPQRFHEEYSDFDVIFCCEERVFDAVCEELLQRAGIKSKPVHVINIEIEDNHREALEGGKTVLELARLIVESKDLEQDMDGIIETVQKQVPHKLLYMLAYY